MPLTAFLRRLCRFLPFAALCIAASCTYKSEIRQGNDTLPDKISELQVGMTQTEVRELLGANRAPVVFTGDDWVYYYRRRSPGFFPKIESWGVVLMFDDEVLSEIRPLSGPEATTE